MKRSLICGGLFAVISLLGASAHAGFPALPTAYGIDAERELMVSDLSVVNSASAKYPGAWSFGSLMENLAGDQDPSKFAYEWAMQFAAEAEINGFLVEGRDGFVTRVLEPWLAESQKNGVEGLDLSVAPFRLLAIVNRIDLRQNSGYGDVNDAGEMRLAFGILSGHSGGDTTLGTCIFEYHMPAKSPALVRKWAQTWHALAQYPLGSKKYLAALEALTTSITKKGAGVGRVNGSLLSQFRTNELLDAPPWQWGEFKLSSDGKLRRVVVAQTPDSSLNDTKALGDYINDNEAKILAGEHVVPLEYRGQPFLGGVSNGNSITLHFRAPNVRSNDARHIVSLNTCVGCHTEETGVNFFQIGPRNHEFRAFLSGFLTGSEHVDPVDGKTIRKFGDILRRQLGMSKLLSESDALIANEKTTKRVH